ncbi:MAG TPA: glycosyl hydrolase family 8, partial [bacterium]|nr:glycosyl hydrolase family 8 [bacterium]
MKHPYLKFFTLVSALFIALSASNSIAAPSVNSNNPTCPFPHNQRYGYGIQPSRYTQTTYAAAASQFYVQWYNNFVTGTGANTRVQRPSNGNDTVSEGIGYGMLIAVEMADYTLFDGLDQYYHAHLDGNGLMNWTCPGGSGCTGNAATDADEDVCMALYMGATQWNNSTYTTQANSIAASLYSKCFAGNGHMNGGDNNTGVVYPDYAAPGWYRCFNTKVGSTGWTNAVNFIYNTLAPALESQWTHGYVPNEVNNDGTFHSPIALGSEGTNNHGYDSSRWGWRIGTDYLWNGQNQGPISMFASSIYSGVSANGYLNYIQEYWNASDGKTATQAGADGASSPCSHLQIGPALVGVMAGLPVNPVDQTFVDDTYDEFYNRLFNNSGCPTLKYFEDTLAMMCMLVATGNFPNIACSGCTAGTAPATPTPMPCFNLDDLEDANIVNATNGYWFTFAYASLNNTPVNPTPTRSIASGVSVIVDGSSSAQNSIAGSLYAAHVTGFWQDNGLSSPATYGGFAIATELKPPYNNLLNLNVGGTGPCSLVDITFSVKATAAMTIRMNCYNPAIDPAAGCNANQYGYTFNVPTTWKGITITLNQIMCQDWASAGICFPVCGGVTYTRNQALTNVTSLQWDTAGNPATLGYWIDNVCLHFAKISNGNYTPVVPYTATPLPTATPTAGANTPTNTATATRTNTATNTRTNTPASTPTNTATSSLTNTATPSRTSTATNTVVSTSTNTATPSRTSTATNTAVSTATNTATPSRTNTALN